MFFFFFSSRRRHTRFDCDWSSDVCSSDLTGIEELRKATAEMAEAADRAAQLGEEIRTVAERHRGDVAAAGSALLDVREVVQTTSKQVAQLAELSASIDRKSVV